MAGCEAQMKSGGIVEGYATSGMTRREYCEKHTISISTLNYWRRKQQKKPKLVGGGG